MTLSIILVLTLVLVVATLLPALPIAHGLVRVCDFPRLQIAALAVVLMAAAALLLPFGAAGGTLVAVNFAVLAAQIGHCLRFTPLWPIQSQPYAGSPDDAAVVRIIAVNVKMSNRSYGKLVDLVRRRDPHIAVFMEVDDAWMEALAPLQERLPTMVAAPLPNSYGMALLSRLPLHEPRVEFLLIDGVPSISTAVELPDGRSFRLNAIHPEPPVPNEDTLGRDGELILTARRVKEDPLPAVVTGDLNDVAWSRTTRRFQRLSGLLDPRIGRGFYNSFDARFRLLRWPLDHLFHDPQFRLVHLERLPHVGSDHFPMLFELALAETPDAEDAPSPPDGDDVEEAREVLRDAASLDREPIGSDWEK